VRSVKKINSSKRGALTLYSELTLEHFQKPQNVGKMDDADAIGMVGDPSCGDTLMMFIKVDGDVISDIKYLVFGCAGSIATSSMASTMIKGKTIDEVLALKDQDVVDALGGLPAEKEHCSNLGIQAVHAAIRNYREKNS
jgi:nitrogen fixation protein NifU and related proteins